MAENSNNFLDALNDMFRANMLDVNTCLPGTIVSYSNGLANISPDVKKRFADGDVLDYPIIQNVRICWPSFSGGNAGFKAPIRVGDKCLLAFSQQAIDGSDDRRSFDLSDAYAIMCDLGRATLSDSTNNDDATMYFGSANLRITSSGQVIINAPGGVTINAAAGVTIDTPNTTNTGTFTTQDVFNYLNGMSGFGGSGTTTINGNITHASGNLSSNGIVLHTHVHGGVRSGGGNTSTPI
jgi:phage baseplate assembly protein gpV